MTRGNISIGYQNIFDRSLPSSSKSPDITEIIYRALGFFKVKEMIAILLEDKRQYAMVIGGSSHLYGGNMFRLSSVIAIIIFAFCDVADADIGRCESLTKDASESEISKCYSLLPQLFTNDSARALKILDAMIQIAPEKYDLWQSRGAVKTIMGSEAEARADYRKAVGILGKEIESDPKNAELYFNRAIVFMDLDEIDNAIKDYEKAVELNPKNRGYQDLLEKVKKLKETIE